MTISEFCHRPLKNGLSARKHSSGRMNNVISQLLLNKFVRTIARSIPNELYIQFKGVTKRRTGQEADIL